MTDTMEVLTETIEGKTFKVFQRWLKKHLAHGPVTVIFTKKDGTERAMLCTTSDSLVPKAESGNVTELSEKPARKVNADVMSVYDLEMQGWRSFRWDSVKQVRFTL